MKHFVFILVLSFFAVGCASKQKTNENCKKTADSFGVENCKKTRSSNTRARSIERFGRF